MRIILTTAMSSVAAGALMPGAAQEAPSSMFQRDKNVGVMDRPRPEYETGGIQRGAFVYSPEVYAGLEFNDNIYATQSNEQSDTILLVEPSVSVASTWSRHSLGANVGVSHREYFEYGSESVTDYNAGLDGTLDIGRGYSTALGASYLDTHEPRTSAGAAGRAAEPIEYDTYGVYATAAREVGRTKLSAGVSLNTFDYDDARLIGGGFADQDSRDRDDLAAEIRGDYALSPDTAVFVRLEGVDQSYTNEAPTAVTTRDQNGYTLDAGASFDLSNLIRGEVGVGYLNRSFDDQSFDDVDGLSVDGLVEWFFTPLVTVSATANRGVQPSAIANSPAYINTAYGARVDYEFRRNIILSAGLDFGEDDYEGIDRTDERNSQYVRATYFLNRYLGLNVDLSRSEQTSSGLNSQPGFEVNKLVVGLTARR